MLAFVVLRNGEVFPEPTVKFIVIYELSENMVTAIQFSHMHSCDTVKVHIRMPG